MSNEPKAEMQSLTPERVSELVKDDNIRRNFARVVNHFSLENGSDTPDWILGEYLFDMLKAFDNAVTKRDAWYGHVTRTWNQNNKNDKTENP